MKLESIVSIGGLLLIVVAALTFKPDAQASPVIVGSPPGELAALTSKVSELEKLNAELKKQAENFQSQLNAALDEARSAKDAYHKSLVAKVTPQVSPARQKPPAGRTLQPAGGGASQNCYGGNCSTQPFRGGPLRRILGR